MKPFTHGTDLTAQQKTYNYRLCQACIVVENAYGRLKSRWQRLMKRNDMSIENIPNIVTAACILHNVCEIHGKSFNEAWLHEIQGSELQQPNPGSVRDSDGDRPKHIRDALVSYFNS